MAIQHEIRLKRLLWRASHRGTKELDVLIGGFATERLADMTETQLATFEDLIEEHEPTLQRWLLASSLDPEIDAKFTGLVSDIRKFHGLSGSKSE